ncbi:hypothetical protein C7B80_02170 [Cyanosarcina cf. burmensis CCALA 770]|nr:hypothetical protein C7B80_02170 [Cyanosarcina cf. burmensis CCALA 770]
MTVLTICFIRFWFRAAIDYNEGWNAYHTLKAISGQNLYDGQNQLTPVNYPPLSFYIVGVLGKILGGDIVLAGRLISFTCLLIVAAGVSYAVKKLGGQFYESTFAGVLFLGWFTGYATYYIGMNDPQLLAHLFAMGSFLLYLDNYKNQRLFLIALLLSVALFIKHSLLPLPIAITIDICLNSRSKFIRWLIYLAAILGSLTLITLILTGNGFLYELTTGRHYSLGRTRVYLTSPALQNLLLCLIVTLPWIYSAFQKTHLRFISIYIIMSIIFGVLTIGGLGTDLNMFFDAFIGLSIASGLYLAALRAAIGKRLVKLSYANLILFTVPVILSLNIFVSTLVNIMNPEMRIYPYWQAKEHTFLKDVAFLSTQSDPVLCENILLCYRAGKKFAYDPFLVSQMMVRGRIEEKTILQKLESGYFNMIQLEQKLDSSELQNLSYTPEPKIFIKNERFTINFIKTIEANYNLIRQTATGAFYVPKKKGN